jgi:hypothetical protein
MSRLSRDGPSRRSTKMGCPKMKVMRIVPNISTPNTAKAKEFYADVLGLDLVKDLGWIATYASNEPMTPQISIASEGGSGTNVPEIYVRDPFGRLVNILSHGDK